METEEERTNCFTLTVYMLLCCGQCSVFLSHSAVGQVGVAMYLDIFIYMLSCPIF